MNIKLTRTSRAFLLILLVALSSARVALADIVPAGTTPTSVGVNGRGQAIVLIAAPVSGVSHNTFVEFNASKPGVQLDNASAKARVIVNEVVSNKPSLLEGTISVVGPRANVIVANPNGITVDGASFTNTGNVALSTGRVHFNDFNVAPGLSQRNVALTTKQGSIEVGPNGLSGAFNSLELIAKQLRINGPVINTVSRTDARIRAVAGDSKAEIDSSVSPTDNLTPWIAYESAGTINQGAILVDITGLGIMTAGKIQIAVTDQGAGVRHAGALYANFGDFTLSATGDLHVAGGSVRAAQTANVKAATLTLRDGARLISDSGAIVVEATQAVELLGGELSARGDIAVTTVGFTQRNSSSAKSITLAAEGGVWIDASGDVQNVGSLIQGNVPLANGAAVAIKSGGAIRNISVDEAAQPAVIYAGAGDVKLEAAGDIANHGARVIAAKDVVMHAGSTVTNDVEVTGAVADGAIQSFQRRTHDWLGLPKRASGFSVNFGELAGVHTEAFIKAGNDVVIGAREIANSGGKIYADAGDIRLDADLRIGNAGLAIGEAQFKRHCNVLFCRASTHSNVSVSGGEMSAAHDVFLAAGEEIENVGGRVLALNDLTLTAPHVVARGITGYTSIDRQQGMKSWFGDSWAKIYAADVGGSFTANAGKLTINGTAYTDGASLSAARGVEASGGVVEVRPAERNPVQIDGNRIGVISWFD